MIPTSKAAQRIATLFSRRLTTDWIDKEVRQFRRLVKLHAFDDPENMELIEKYYAFERKRGDKGIHRRDIGTFLNNFFGELDRARAWRTRHFEPKAIASELPPDLTDEQIEKNKEFIKQHMDRLREHMKLPKIVREAQEMFDATLVK